MKKNSVNAHFTSREMNAIAAMLLSKEGINVDPIIEDLYPNLAEEQKSLFRCKIALLLKGNMPAFQVRRGFRRTGGSYVHLFEVIGESSLLGTIQLRKVAKYTRKKDENGESWAEEPLNDYEEDLTESLDYQLFETLEEAVKNW